jgi:threonine synthase
MRKLVERGKLQFSWFDMSTLRAYRIEGKPWAWVGHPVGLAVAGRGFLSDRRRTGLIGMWKAWQELKALGWISGPLPRLVAVQSTGCAPIVRAFESGASSAAFWEAPDCIRIRVPAALGDFLILAALRDSAASRCVTDADIKRRVRTSACAMDCFSVPKARQRTPPTWRRRGGSDPRK